MSTQTTGPTDAGSAHGQSAGRKVLQSGRYGPVDRGGRSRGQRASRIARITAIVVGVATLLSAGTVGALVYAGSEAVDRIPIPGLRTRDPVAEASEESSEEEALTAISGLTNILVVGLDSREGLTDQELLELGTEDDGGEELTDTLFLLQLDADTERVVALSFPRDLLVERCDGSRGRINSAYALGTSDVPDLGGPGCLVETVGTLTGIEIDHFVQVDLAGFITAVDAIGGVTFHLEEPLTDAYAGLDVPAGCVTFDGKKALGFVRSRRLDDGADFGRIARQQRFLREVVAKASSLETLANPTRLVPLVRAVGSSLTTDEGLSTIDLARLALTFRNLSEDQLVTVTVPGDIGTWRTASVVLIDPAAEEIFAALRASDRGPDALGTAPPSEAPADPADVDPVRVLNGAGEDGLAARVAGALEQSGFEVSETTDADRFGLPVSRIVYPAGQRDAARALAEVLPGARLTGTGANGELTVVVGEDLQNVALGEGAPSVSESPSAQTSEQPSATASASAPADGPSASEGGGPAPRQDPRAIPTPSEVPDFTAAQRSTVDCSA